MPPQPFPIHTIKGRTGSPEVSWSIFTIKSEQGWGWICQILLPVPSSSPRKFIFISLCNPSPAGIPKPSSPPTSPHQKHKGTAFVLFKPPKILDLKKRYSKHETMKTGNASLHTCTANMHENIPDQLCMQLQYSQTSDKTLKLCFCFKLVWLVAKSNMSGEEKYTSKLIFKYMGSNKLYFPGDLWYANEEKMDIF